MPGPIWKGRHLTWNWKHWGVKPFLFFSPDCFCLYPVALLETMPDWLWMVHVCVCVCAAHTHSYPGLKIGACCGPGSKNTEHSSVNVDVDWIWSMCQRADTVANKLVAHQTLVLCASARTSASAQTGFCLWLNLSLFSTVSCLSSLSFLSFMNKVFLCHTLPSPEKSWGGGGGGMNHFTCLCVSIHLSVTTQCPGFVRTISFEPLILL